MLRNDSAVLEHIEAGRKCFGVVIAQVYESDKTHQRILLKSTRFMNVKCSLRIKSWEINTCNIYLDTKNDALKVYFQV